MNDAAKMPTDANDLDALHGPEALIRLVQSAAPVTDATQDAPADHAIAPGTPPAAPSADGEERESQASQLVAFVLEQTTLFHDANKDVFAQDNTTRETRRIDGRAFRDWLLARFYEITEKSARDQAVREALATLVGIGRHKGECREVFVRVAVHDGDYYLDLAEPNNSRAVHITAGRWRIVDEPPVLFVRPEGLQLIPAPARGGSIAPLWKIANIPENARLLAVAWLCECLRPDTPFPVLELFGEQGCAKSTTQAAFRRLIDPNACDLRAAPKSGEDIFVSAGVNWLVSYENLSHMPGPMQDALCTLATGGGFAKRKLYTDADEAIIRVQRPVALNGISIVVTQQDLIDRTVTIELPAIKAYEDSAAVNRAFDAERGRILGGLLDLMVKALARIDSMTLPPDERPRLIEFARLGMALAVAAGKPAGAFMEQFNASRSEAVFRTIDSSPVATALIEWFQKSGKQPVTLAVGDLMRRVEAHKAPNSEAWPRTPKGFADALRRAAPGLRHVGIECQSLGKIGGAIRWEVGPKRNSPTQRPESPACPDPGPDTSPTVGPQQDIRTCRTWPARVSSPDTEVI